MKHLEYKVSLENELRYYRRKKKIIDSKIEVLEKQIEIMKE